MNKQRSALLNFYFSYEPIGEEVNESNFNADEIDINLVTEKKAKLLKKVKAKQRIIEGEKFAKKVKQIFKDILDKKINPSDLGLSEGATSDIVLEYNKFKGDEENLTADKLKEKTRLEIIEKIKKGEL